MQYALMSEHTPAKLKRALSAMIGAPYALEAGYITEISGDTAYLNGRPYSVDSLWGHKRKIVGQEIEFLGSFVDTISVFDWKSNPQEILDRIDTPWKLWGTYLVKISSALGMNAQNARDVERLLSRSESIHIDHIVEYVADDEEDLAEEIDFEYSSEINAHTDEDLIFDKHDAVVLNDVSETTDYYEQQLGVNKTFLHLDEFYIPRPRIFDGETYWGEAAREFAPSEKCYELLWLYDPDSLLSAYSDTDWFETTPDASADYNDVIILESGDVLAAGDIIYRSRNSGRDWVEELDTGTAFVSVSETGLATDGSTVYQMVEEGSWEDRGVPAFTPQFVSRDFLVGDNSGDIEFSAWDGSSWSTPVVVDTSGTAYNFHAYNDTVMWIATGDGVFYTKDGGSTWSQTESGTSFRSAYQISSTIVLFGDSGAEVYRVQVSDLSVLTSVSTSTGKITDIGGVDDIAYFVTDGGGIHKTDDGGANWSNDTGWALTVYDAIAVDVHTRVAVKNQEISAKL